MAFSEIVFGNGHSFDRVITDQGLALIIRWETFQARRYLDASKKGSRWAIGFGHTEGGDVEPKIIPSDMVLTFDQAHEILRADCEKKAQWLRKQIKVPVTTPMFNSLVSLTLNAGEGNVEKGLVIDLLNQEKYIAACAAFVDPVRGHIFASYDVDKDGQISDEERHQRINGLICRRMTEGAMFMTKKERTDL